MAAQFRPFLDETREAFLVAGADFKIVYANEKALALYGYLMPEILGIDVRDLFVQSLRAAIRSRFSSPDSTPPLSFETLNLRKNNAVFPVDMIISSVQWNGENAYLVLARDLAAFKKTHDFPMDARTACHRLLEQSLDGVVIVADGVLRYLNDAACKYLGAATRTDIVSHPLTAIVHGPDQARVSAVLEGMQGGHVAAAFLEAKIRTLSGAIIDMEGVAIPFMYENANAVQIIFRDVTRHKREKEDLQEKLAALENSTPDFIVFKDGEGRWLEANRAAVDIFHLKGIAYRGRTDSELAALIPPLRESLTACADSDRRAWEEKRSVQVDEKLPGPDGAMRIFETIKTPLFDPGGARRGIVAVGRDVTERRRTEQKNRDSRAAYENMVARSADGVAVIIDGKHVYMNPAGLRIYEAKTMDEVIAMPPERLVLPDFRQEALRTLQKVLAEQSMGETKTGQIVTLTGKVLDTEYIAIPCVFEGRNGVQFIFRDITEKKRESADLREKLSTLINSTPDFIVFKDGQGRWMDANKAAIEVFDLGTVDYHGLTDLEMVPLTDMHKETLIACDESDRLAWRKRTSISVDEHVTKADGRVLVYDTIKTPIFNPDGSPKGMVALGRDVTSQRNAERNERETLLKLRCAMEGVIQLIVNITEVRDAYTSGHQRRVAQLATRIAEEMKLPQDTIDAIHVAASIHDLGKIYVPVEILSKAGVASDLESNIYKTHPRIGYDLLKVLEFPWPIGEIILQHHERLNGSGYPAGMVGEQIRIEARIIGVADDLELMSSSRASVGAQGIKHALEQIAANRGILYDPVVVDVCLDLFNKKHFRLQGEKS